MQIEMLSDKVILAAQNAMTYYWNRREQTKYDGVQFQKGYMQGLFGL